MWQLATSISSVLSLELLSLWACSIWWAVCVTSARLTDTSSTMLRSGDFRAGTWTTGHKNGMATQWSYNRKFHTHWLLLFQTLLPCHLLHFSINLLQFHGQLNSELHMEDLTATLIKSRNLQHFTIKIGPSFLLTSHFTSFSTFKSSTCSEYSLWITQAFLSEIGIFYKGRAHKFCILLLWPLENLKQVWCLGLKFSRYAETNDPIPARWPYLMPYHTWHVCNKTKKKKIYFVIFCKTISFIFGFLHVMWQRPWKPPCEAAQVAHIKWQIK